MYEINVKNLTSASRDFSTARDAILDRFMRFHDRHSPRGPLPVPDLPLRKRAGCSVALTITQHSLLMMGAFRKEWYAPCLTLLRPILEALLRLTALHDRDDKSDWEEILFNQKRFKVTDQRLSAVSKRTGLPDVGPLWKEISNVLNDHVHQRAGQWLTVIGDESEHHVVLSNPIEQSCKPIYPAGLIWEAAYIATLAATSTHCIAWELLGDENRAKRCREDLQNEDWDRIETSRNGQTVYILCRVGKHTAAVGGGDTESGDPRHTK